MSYDVSIGPRSFNYTSNASALFYDHIADVTAGGGIHELHGKTGREACQIIQEALERINRTRHDLWSVNAVGEPKFFARYDAPNGWGSALGAILFLSQILGACAEHPRKRVSVSA